MAFKDLWIVSDEGESEKKEQKKPEPVAPIKFPEKEAAVQVVAPVIGSTNCEPHMEAVMSLYEKGFESLNKPGVEFFEYFKSVASAGIDNPQAYTMAYNMLRGLDNSMTKDSLMEQSKFYIDEINKVHQVYTQNGNSKKIQIETQKNVETEKLKSDLTLLKQQFETVQNQIQSKEIALEQMNTKYNPEVEEIGCKLAANDMAKDKILGTLNKVVSGIRTNL